MKALFRVTDGIFGRGGFTTSEEAIVWANGWLENCNLLVDTWVGDTRVTTVIGRKRDGEWEALKQS